MQTIEAYKTWVSTPKNIVILPHFNPDADALGASTALALYLKAEKHSIRIISSSIYPRFLSWMTDIQAVEVCESKDLSVYESDIQNADIVFCLDFSSYSRVNHLEAALRSTKAKIVVIDHHLDPSIEADYQLWNSKASSTAELVYDFMTLLGGEDDSRISKAILERIYAGIITDTASFKYPSTTKRAHEIAIKIMEKGVDTSKIQRLIYDNNTESRLRFLGYALKEKLTVLPEYNTAYFVIKDEEQKRFNNQKGDTEGLVNYALSIKGIHFAVIIIEKHDCVKMSFRSVGDFPVNEFASKYFNGGGHKNAAGGRCEEDLESILERFKTLLETYKGDLIKLD